MKRYVILSFFLPFAILQNQTFAAESKLAERTALFYVGADEEEVRSASFNVLKKLEQIPGLVKGGPVNIIVQFDDAGEDPNYRYDIRTVEKPTDKLALDTPPIPETEIRKVVPNFKYRERDSGNVITLKEFIEWGMKAYPAKHYDLFVLAHSWATSGISMDWFRDGKEHKTASIIKLYEVRRMMEEIARADLARSGKDPKRRALPDGKFDLFLADSCIMGQLEVAYELKDNFKYFAATSVEMPFYSLPYDRIFGNLIKVYQNRTKETDTEITENSLLKPLVSLFAEEHGPEGGLSKKESNVDVTGLFALRTNRLGGVIQALRDLSTLLLDKTYEPTRKKMIKYMKRASDMDKNADLYQLTLLLQEFIGQQKPDKRWDEALEKVHALRASLGYQVVNETIRPLPLKHASAAGALVHMEVDSVHPGQQLIACLALRNFILLNKRNKDFLPVIWDEDGEKVDISDLDCFESAKEQKYDAAKEIKKFDKAWKIEEVFGMTIEWPTGVKGFITDASLSEVPSKFKADKKQEVIDGKMVGRRVLSVWIPKSGAALDRSIIARLPGTRRITVDYLESAPEKPGNFPKLKKLILGQETLEVPAFQITTDPKKLIIQSEPNLPGMYVAEAHSNGSYFKHGLGIYFNSEYDNGMYGFGRNPIEKVEPKPYAWTLEYYFKLLRKTQTVEANAVEGRPFYSLHRIADTKWPELIFIDKEED